MVWPEARRPQCVPVSFFIVDPFPLCTTGLAIPFGISPYDDGSRRTPNQVFCSSRRLFFCCLLVVLLGLVVNDVVELELINTLGGGDDAEPVAKLHLLEELLGPGSAQLSAAGGLSRREQLREKSLTGT
jgi:hypothetical protein